jgi:hypothetical protein
VPGDRIPLIVSYLKERDFILEDRGYLMPGQALEAWDRQRNPLYSVIGEGRMCEVRTRDGDAVGSLPVKSADLVRSRPFRLGGRSWNPCGSQAGSGILEVDPRSVQADPPVFKGSSQGISPVLLRVFASIIREGLPDLPFPDSVHDAVQEMARNCPPGSGPDTVVISREKEDILVYTFLGEDWNRLIAFYLKDRYRCEFSRSLRTGYTGVLLRLPSGPIDPGWVLDALLTMRDQDAAILPSWLSGKDPSGRLYDRFLPAPCHDEMMSRDRYQYDTLLKTLAASRIFISG